MDPQKVAVTFGVREGMRIADFGCGSGHFTILMAKVVGDSGVITAIDVLETALDTIRAKAKNENLNNINTVRSNLEVPNSSGLMPSSQDLVLLANILFQSDKKEEIVKEAARILKTGGGMIVINWKKGAGGFGPPDEMRTDPVILEKMVSGLGFKKVNEFDAGVFHSGFIFRKL